MDGFVKVAKVGELQPGEAKRVEVAGKAVALFNLEGVYHALEDACPHRGGPLSEGQVEGETVVCPWHGASFDIASGEVLAPPARTAVRSYPVRVTGADVEILVPTSHESA